MPWRAARRGCWTTLHFMHRDRLRPAACEAWVRRPGNLLVRTPGRSRAPVNRAAVPRRRCRSPAAPCAVIPDPDATLEPRRSSRAPPGPTCRAPQVRRAARRPDGLVAERPSDWTVDYDDPMCSNYAWVAMLDPVELSHHVARRRACVRTRSPAGRPGGRPWWPVPGYEPALRRQLLRAALQRGGPASPTSPTTPPESRRRGADADYPDHYDVALDVGTGVVVRLPPGRW